MLLMLVNQYAACVEGSFHTIESWMLQGSSFNDPAAHEPPAIPYIPRSSCFHFGIVISSLSFFETHTPLLVFDSLSLFRCSTCGLFLMHQCGHHSIGLAIARSYCSSFPITLQSLSIISILPSSSSSLLLLLHCC